MNQRLALLSAILANPDDDLPRLVFADWLEENGTSDADAARVEFIRLGCKGKAKARMTTAEGKWLTRNWRRLLPNALVVFPDETKRPVGSRQGRYLTVTFRWMEAIRYRLSAVRLDYARGFLRWAEYGCCPGYLRVWQLMTVDEPLAFHRPRLRPESMWTAVGTRAFISTDTWGVEVFHRLKGFEAISTAQGKSFNTSADFAADAGFDPVVVAAEEGMNTAQQVARAAVATAMTAIAREHVGLDPAV